MTTSDGLRVSAELALTLQIPGVDYGMVKPAIRIDGIDPNGDVEAQITLGLETAAKTLVRLDEHMEVAIHDMLAPETGAPGYRERLAATENLVNAQSGRINEIIKRMKNPRVAAAIAEAVEAGELTGDAVVQ